MQRENDGEKQCKGDAEGCQSSADWLSHLRYRNLYVCCAGEYCAGRSSGIALMVNFVTGLPVGTLTLVLNVPLLILAWFYLSKKFAVSTAITTAVCSFVLDFVVPLFIPVYAGE